MSSLSSHKTPAHRLNIEKAVDQLNKNVLACTDTGFSNETGKFNAANETHTENIKTHTTGSKYLQTKNEFLLNKNNLIGVINKKEEKILLKSVEEWREKNVPHPVEPPDLEEDTKQIENSEKNKKKYKQSSSIVWLPVEISDNTNSKDVINFILNERSRLNWQTRLPVFGTVTRQVLDAVTDKLELENRSYNPDNGLFTYCICLSDLKRNLLYSPYDLLIATPDEIKSYRIYYTVTASNITCVNNHKSMEVENVLKWIWEKQQFQMMRKLKIFYLYRKRKTFLCWRQNVRESKNSRAKELLTRRLFTANEVFQTVLLHVRNLCERGSNSRNGLGIDENSQIIMIKFDPTITYTLDDFRSIQFEQIELALERLKALQDSIIDICYMACISVGQLEGIDFDAFFDHENFKHEKSFIESYLKHRQNRTTRLRDPHLKLPTLKEKGPSYVKRKEWRFILSRLSGFLRMIDYQIQELVHRVVKTSVKQLNEYMCKSMNRPVNGDENYRKYSMKTMNKVLELTDIKQEENINDDTPDTDTDYYENNYNQSSKKPSTSASNYPKELNDPEEFKTIKDIDNLLENIKSQSIVEIKVEPIFKTNLVLNINKQDEIVDIDENEENEKCYSRATSSTFKNADTEISEDEETLRKRRMEASLSVYLSLSPNQSDFKNFFRDLIAKYEETAGKIQTLLHEPKFRLFYEIPIYELTEPEREARLRMDNSLTSDGELRPWPEVEFLFGEDENYQDLVYNVMKNATQSINEVSSYAEIYNKYCLMVASVIRLDIEKSIKEKQFSPEDFHFLLSKHTDQLESMDGMITSKRTLIFDFNASQFQSECLPYVKNVIAVINSFMPQMAISRNEKLQETMRDALKMLDRDPASVEDFVEHLATLTRINNELPLLENEFLIVTRLFNIAHEFNLDIDPEQYAFFKSLGSTFHHLKTSLLYTEAQSEENIRKFTVDLGALITKAHNESIDLKVRLQSPGLLSSDTLPQIANENLTLFEEMIGKLVEKAKNYASYQERFGNTLKQVKKKSIRSQEYSYQDYGRSSVSLFTLQSELNELEHDINLRKLLWKSIEEWDYLIKIWLNKLLDEIKVDLIQKDVNRFTQNIYLLEKGLPHNELVPKLKEKILDFKKALPIIIALRNPNLKPRHYSQLKLLIGYDLIVEKEKITMSVLLNADVLQYRDKISDISALATNESTLETMLNRIIDIWKKTDFRLVKDHLKDTFIITGTDEIQILLEESQVTMSTIKSSRYVGPIKMQVEDWDRRLTLFSKTLDEWITCQKRWVYLKQIFSAADIQRQLNQETKIFNQIEKFWKDLMRRTDDKPNALRAATAPGLYESLQSYAVQMEKIQKSLEDYFETKRLIFPRLYFLSNEDLLDILSQSKDPNKIQPHLNKCFANINSLEINEKYLEITHLISFEGEKLDLLKTIKIRGATEAWLGALENGMYDSIKRHLKIGLAEFSTTVYKDWIVKQSGQIVLLVSQINFNKQIVKSMHSSNVLESLNAYRESLIEGVNTASNMMSKELPNHKLLTVEALLTIQVHARDILTGLVENKVTSVDNYEWKRHLRYEWDDHTNQCTVMQSDATFSYGFEYLGCSPRLVITPLTDRCYLTLTGALKLNLGGAPAGPAGTGKTETVKDLAKSVGKLCLVFNCSEGLDYKMLGKFFSGLAQSGSWCCFDEFNRIDIEVLSVVAQQMLTIKTSKDQLAPRFIFEGRDIRLNSTCGFFITMNPTYAGRVELPDNLKPLFRPVAMMVADYALIAEIILFSVGFHSAKILATKIATLYHLASRQLSQQDHYDFGMRSIKAVLLMAGQIKKKFMTDRQQQQQQQNKTDNAQYSLDLSEEQESRILMQALYDTNLPKYLKDDVVLFQNLMNDLFPNISKLNKNQEAIERSIYLATRELNYQLWPSQAQKINQLYDQMLVRHGIMLVGPTGGGKTVARNILSKALSILPGYMNDKTNNEKQKIPQTILKSKRARIENVTINPKSISIGELYGTTDLTTFEWTDGIFANVIRNFASSSPSTNAAASTGQASGTNETVDSENSPVWQFVVLDGPVDTFWVENLNTVLDDSKVLCLSNGERINLTPSIRVLFEVDSLIHTSPATVSRCAMVYFDPSDLGLTPSIKNWFNSLPKSFPQSGIDLINEILDFSLNKGFNFIESRKGSTSFPFQRQNVLNCMFALIGSFLEFFERNGGFGEISSNETVVNKKKTRQKIEEETLNLVQVETTAQKQYFLQRNPKLLQAIVIKIYIFSYIWAFGGVLKREDNSDDDNIINQKSHVKSNFDSLTHEFDEMVRELFEANVKYGIYLPPNSKPVFDFFLDVATGNFVEWNHLVPSVDSLIRQTKLDSIIETIDSVRFSFLSSLLLMGKHSVIITGSSGIGKTVIIENMLKRLTASGFSFKPNTILGNVFNFVDKTKVTLMSNMATSIFSEEQDVTKKANQELSVLTNTIQFSAQTSSSKFLSMFVSRLFKKGSNTLGAPRNKCIVTFIDDLNIPIADMFGDQPPLELLRFMKENNGFYDVKNCSHKNITDVSFIVCCDTPTSSRTHISPRLISQFCILSMPDPSARSLFNIYQVQLGRFYSENEFNMDIKSNLQAVVSASIVIFYRTFINLLPTPAKSHYVFNLRDLAKLIQGIMQASPSVVITKENLVDLFAHESIRVFSDRLICKEDIDMFNWHLNETINDYFKLSLKPSSGNNQKQQAPDDSPNTYETTPILYGDFLKNDDRVYQPLSNWKQLISVLSEYQMRSNMSGHATKQIVFFKEAVEHVCRACRVLRQPNGHMLLIGLDGTGKSTIMELATYISNCEIYKLNIKKGYTYADFRDDLKSVFKLTAIQKKRIVLFIADKDVSDEVFLEDLDSLLTTGNIPDLFDVDELDALFMEIKNSALMDGITDEKSELYKYMIKRVQFNLHLIISMSPVGTKFRERCRFHPAILNCTTIDWYNDWSEHAMKQVSMSFMESINFKTNSMEENELKEKISKACVYIHMSLINASARYFNEHKRHYYVTPSCYIDLLKTFNKIHESKTNEYLNNLTRLKNGLEKLSDANKLVSLMKEELIALGPKIEIKAKETEELMAKLVKDQEAVNEVRTIVAKDEEKMRTETQLVMDYAREAEKDLEDVKPLLEQAKESLSNLDKADISEIRVYNSPPYLVMTVMCAVCIILDKKPDWSSAKQLIGDSSFIHKIVTFNPETVTEKTYIKFKQYSKLPDFDPDIVGKVSKACKSLCSWVLAVGKFHEVYRTVKPKEEKVKEANEALSIMSEGLRKKQHMLEQIQKHLDAFKKKYDESLNERKSLEDRKELMKVRMQRASELTSALDIEKIRWNEQYEELERQANVIVGVSIVCAGAVNYLGAMTQDYRAKLVNDWVNYCNQIGLEVNPNFDLSKNVVKQHEIRTWINQKLPDDQYSIENAIFLKYSLKWPLIIDPQNQVVDWIRETEGAQLRICKSEDPQVFRTLEQAIRLGQAVLIENVTEFIDPVLDSILHKQIITRGAQKIIKLGDVEVEYNDAFRLYLVTSLPNPHYLPSAFIKVNLINFTITFKCLFEQFLSLVVLKERPELENERTFLLEQIAKDFLTLRELEDRSLNMLSNSNVDGGDSSGGSNSKTLLDDQNLINVLKQTKETSLDIEHRLKKNEDTEKSLNLARQRYSPIAIRATILYFTVQNLAELNVMYQFSLSWFYNVFQSCLGNDIETGVRKLSYNENEIKSSLMLGGGGVDSALNLEYFADSNGAKLSAGTLRPAHRAVKTNISSSSSLSVNESTLENDAQTKADFKSDSEFKTYIDAIIYNLTQTVYQAVSWALFAQHQLIFSFSLCVNILKHAESQSVDRISAKGYNFFLNSTLLADMQQDALTNKIKTHPCDLSAISRLFLLDEKILRQLLLLEESLPDCFRHVCTNMIENYQTTWSQLMTCTDPYELMSNIENNPNMDLTKLKKFEKLILIKLIRPDALILAINHFISETLGSRFLSSGVPTLHELYNQSIAHTPIIFILSPGSDPTNQLLRFAKELRGSTLHMDIISLGQGQGPRAEELINKSLLLKGRWIFLQNCHLAASFMPRLQAIVNNFNRPGVEIDKQFRLFLSSKPDDCFPISLLKTGIKMTIESPRGLKNNLKQNLGPGGLVSKRLFENADNGPHWKRLLFSLGFIHALIHERKKFGPLGWNLPYEFNNSDLEVAILQLQSILSINKDQVPFDVLKYICGEIIYGGRVTDDYDRRCLLSILGKFFANHGIDETFHYGDNNLYLAPKKDVDYANLMSYIEELPDEDDPSIFGMNIYAEKMLRATQAENLINSMVVMEPMKASQSQINEGKNDNDLVIQICNDITTLLPRQVMPVFTKGKHITFEEALLKLPDILAETYYENSAMNTIIRQEIDRYNRLLSVIFKSIDELVKAIRGEIMISKTSEDIFSSFLVQKVPKEWAVNAYASLKPLASWIKNLYKRIRFFSMWCRNIILYVEIATGLANTIPSGIVYTSIDRNPHSVWISGFIFPQGLLAAISQNYARKYKTSIDSLEFKYEIKNEIFNEQEIDVDMLFEPSKSEDYASARQDDGILLCGFYIDGAKWDRQQEKLLDSPQRFTVMPHILCKLVKKQTSSSALNIPKQPSTNKDTDNNQLSLYKCPVYRNSVRAGNSNDQNKNYVTSIQLKCSENAEFWILRGVCMILQNDD